MSSIASRKQEIERVQAHTFGQTLPALLEEQLRKNVVHTVQATIEAALVEELNEALQDPPLNVSPPRRSGYYGRTVDTQYGRIERLRVPKLRSSNREREWQILARYQRGLRGWLDWVCYLYVLGLSLRDLQVLLYWQLNHVLSRNAVNQVTLSVQQRLESESQSPIESTPCVLVVDGVWVDIQYNTGEMKVDRSGHRRQARQAQERVILAVMAQWPDGRHELLHYEVAAREATDTWEAVFKHMIERGLDPAAVQVVVSDGSKGLLTAMANTLPQAQQQRCITHKVRGMTPYLRYRELPETDEMGQPLTPEVAKAQRKAKLFRQAYDIYDAPSYEQAMERKQAFIEQWEALEPDAIHAFKWGIERTFTFYELDSAYHRLSRTTNALERLFREFRAKADEIGAFPNEQSCLTLFFLVTRLDHFKHDRYDSGE